MAEHIHSKAATTDYLDNHSTIFGTKERVQYIPPPILTEELSRIDSIRATLKTDVSFDVGERLREELRAYAAKLYVSKYPKRYMKFLNQHLCSFEQNHAQEKNRPYVMTMFFDVLQHVVGDCVEECLDKAIEGCNFKAEE